MNDLFIPLHQSRFLAEDKEQDLSERLTEAELFKDFSPGLSSLDLFLWLFSDCSYFG